MNYLTIENISKRYGVKVLFENISLFINKGDRIALVAKNGTGKTSLMRILAGEEGADGEQGKILISKEIRTGFLVQDPLLDPTLNVEQAVFSSQNPFVQAIVNYQNAIQNQDTPPSVAEAAMMRMEELKAWDFESKIREILSKLKLDIILTRNVTQLSGGQRKRIALAQLLIDAPDFLILDEPTNHLDLDMIEWLQEYLTASPNLTLFMVTHDRYFLDGVCNTIIELDKGKIYRYRGNYAYFLEQKSLRQDVESANYAKNRKLYLRELEWMRRTPAARTSKAKSREDDFYEVKEKVTKTRDDEMQMGIKTTWLGSKIVELYNVSKKFGNTTILENFSYKFRRRERVGIVGPNGAGKSTLLQLLTAQLAPDTGKIVVGDTISFGHYRQEGINLKDDKRVIDVITDIAEYIPLEKGLKLTAASLLEKFLFSREQQQVYASQLSGGEKRRLYLLTIIMKNPNFLILDEPTNDLDILTLNVLEDFLEDYSGCLVIVTHDRYFMDRLVEHIFVLEGDGTVKDYNGNYTEFREEEKLRRQELRAAQNTKRETPPSVSAQNLANRKQLQRLEREIANLEKRKTEIEAKFNDSSLSITEITKLSKELETLQQNLEAKEMQWLELSE